MNEQSQRTVCMCLFVVRLVRESLWQTSYRYTYINSCPTCHTGRPTAVTSVLYRVTTYIQYIPWQWVDDPIVVWGRRGCRRQHRAGLGRALVAHTAPRRGKWPWNTLPAQQQHNKTSWNSYTHHKLGMALLYHTSDSYTAVNYCAPAHLSLWLDSLDQAAEDEDPGAKQTQNNFPA